MNCANYAGFGNKSLTNRGTIDKILTISDSNYFPLQYFAKGYNL